MSTLKRDADVLEKSRKALVGAEVPLRDQVVKELFDKLKEQGIGQKVVEIWDKETASRGSLWSRQEEFLMSWDNFIPEEPEDSLFEGASNLHLPIIFTAVKTFHARMFQAIMGVDPAFSMKARREDSVQSTEMVYNLMSYTMKEWINENRGCEDVVDAWLWDWITTGMGILKAGWDTKYEKFVDVVKVPYKTQVVVTLPTGEQTTVPVDRYREREKEVVIVRSRGPTLQNIKREDFLAVGGVGDDPDTSDVVMHRDYLTGSQLWLGVDKKLYDEDAVSALIHRGKSHKSLDGNALKELRSSNAGKATLDTESELDRYEVLEAYLSHDVDDDGINSEIVVWVAKATGELLRATYLRRVMRSGERPFSTIHFHNRGDGSGLGLVEIMFPIAEEIDAQHNMKIDFGLISNMPYFFYRPSSNIDAIRESLAPGKGIPLDNPQTDVYFPPMSNRTAFGAQEEQNLQIHLQRLTGLSDMSMGMLTGDQGATRTATGARALVGESNANLDIHLRRANRGWGRALKLTLHNVQQRIPDGFAFRVTGTDGNNYFASIKDKDDIAGDWDFEISPNTANSNRAITQQTAANIVALLSNPIDYQLGVVTPSHRYEGLKNQLQQWGVKDWNRYVQKPKFSPQMTPEGEVMALLNGQEVPVTLEGDHAGFLTYWEYIKAHQELLGSFDTAHAVLVEKQAQKHREMMQAVRQMAAQQANVMQARQNAEMSQHVAAPAAAGNVGGPPVAAPGSGESGQG